MKFSVVIPARDEEARIGACLRSIETAARPYPGEVETVVVVNRCRDRTEEIARDLGARVVREDARNLSAIRNAGARAAHGDILITLDADSVMSPRMLTEVDRALETGRYVGGGVPIHPERMSLGIFLTGLVLYLILLPHGISGGAFWSRREDFKAIGGFDEGWITAEDVDFARRLKAHGRRQGKRYRTLWRTPIRTSCRKFDTFGDWFFVRNLRLLRKALRGKDDGLGNRFFYDFPHEGTRPDSPGAP